MTLAEPAGDPPGQIRNRRIGDEIEVQRDPAQEHVPDASPHEVGPLGKEIFDLL